MAAPRVSVIMPVHNRERYVREAVESILAQTYRNLELIVVDDASADGTPGALAEIADSRLVVIRNAHNLGAARSRNVALEQAQGEFIALMDSDDRCVPDRLARQVVFLDEHPHLAGVGAWARYIDAQGEYAGKDYLTPTAPEDVRERITHQPGCPAHATLVLRREALVAAGGYRPFRWVEDYDLLSRLTDQEACLAVLPEYLYEYRTHDGQETSQDRETGLMCVFLVQEATARRRSGLRDPLEGVDYSGFLQLAEDAKSGRGPWGRAWRARNDWARASDRWDAGDHRGAAREMLRLMCYRPGYGPMWRRVGEALRERLGRGC